MTRTASSSAEVPRSMVDTALNVAFVLAAGITGLYYRARVLRSPPLFLNGDEAVTGIAGDLIKRGHLPVVTPGNAYGGTTESFLFAASNWLPMDRALLLKCCSVVLWLVAAVLVAWTARLLAGRLAGLLAGSVVWVCGGAMTVLSGQAYMGYASGLAYVSGCYLLAVRYIDAPVGRRRFDVRLLLLGFLAGLAVWSHPMFMCSAAPLTLTVAVIGYRRSKAAPVLIGVGGFIALAPYIAWNAANGWPALKTQPVPFPSTYLQRLRIFVTQLSPRGLGLRGFGGRWSWGTSGRVLYAVLILLALVGFVTFVRSGRTSARMVAGVAVLIFPLMALFPSLVFFTDGRYFINVLAPWAVLGAVGLDSLLRRVPWSVALCVAAIPLSGFIFNSAFLDNIVGTQWGDPEAPVRSVLAELDKRQIHAVFGSYWVMGRIALLSEERVATESLYPIERFPGLATRSRAVNNAQRAAVFPIDDDRASLLPLPLADYDRQVFGNIVVYFPRP